MRLNPYLTFNGDCAEAFTFYEQCFGAKIGLMMTWRGSPMEAHAPPDHLDKIMHGSMMVGDTPLMGADASPERYQKPGGITVSIAIADPAEAERVFAALSVGGAVMMPIAETFWALRFGMLTDKFGIPWMINCERPQ